MEEKKPRYRNAENQRNDNNVRRYGVFDKKVKQEDGEKRENFRQRYRPQQDNQKSKRFNPRESPKKDFSREERDEKVGTERGRGKRNNNFRGGRFGKPNNYLKRERGDDFVKPEDNEGEDRERQTHDTNRRGRGRRNNHFNRKKEKEMLEEVNKEIWKPKREDVLDVITEVNEAKANIDKNKPTEEMCGATDLLEYLYGKKFAPFEVDENGIPDPTKIVKPYKRSTSANIENPCDFRTEDSLVESMIFLLDIMDNPKYNDISVDEKFIYVSDRIRAIHTDIIHQSYVSVNIFDIAHAAIRFYAFYSFQINCDNYDFSKEQLKQWLLTLKQLYASVEQIADEEDMNYVLEEEENDEKDRFLLFTQLQIGEIVCKENSENLIEFAKISDALRKMDYSQIKKSVEDVFPVCYDTLVFHSLFRMRLIEMRHKVLSSWAGVMQLPIPVPYVVDALMYDDEKECIDDLISCGIEIREDNTFLAKQFDIRDCKRIPRNKSQVVLKKLIASKEEEFGDSRWSEVFFPQNGDESFAEGEEEEQE